MKKLIDGLKVFLFGLLILGVAGGSIYGCYWLTKTVSYSFFYEDMVERTVIKMVKPEYLKN